LDEHLVENVCACRAGVRHAETSALRVLSGELRCERRSGRRAGALLPGVLVVLVQGGEVGILNGEDDQAS